MFRYTYTYSEMIAIVKLINMAMSSHNYCFVYVHVYVWWERWESVLAKMVYIWMAVLLTIVIVRYIDL